MNKYTKSNNFTGVILLLVCALLFSLFSAGCAKSNGTEEESETGSEVSVYYLDKNGLSVQETLYNLMSEDTEDRIQELLDRLSVSDSVDVMAPITDFSVQGTEFGNGDLTIDLSPEFSSLNNVRQALVRTAIVLTMTQVPDVTDVTIKVDGEDIIGADGNPVGSMTRDSFVLNLGKDINSYEKARLHLYFATADGDKLSGVYRSVVYNSNISKEKLVVEELLKGPKSDNFYPTINPSAGLISVTSKDGVCYVNFDKNFLTEPYAVTPEVAIYSIVDSLTELSGITKVQISIDGDTTSSFMEMIPLQTVFSRDLSLVEQ